MLKSVPSMRDQMMLVEALLTSPAPPFRDGPIEP
jgi:hypothetical protein